MCWYLSLVSQNVLSYLRPYSRKSTTLEYFVIICKDDHLFTCRCCHRRFHCDHNRVSWTDDQQYQKFIIVYGASFSSLLTLLFITWSAYTYLWNNCHNSFRSLVACGYQSQAGAFPAFYGDSNLYTKINSCIDTANFDGRQSIGSCYCTDQKGDKLNSVQTSFFSFFIC